MSGKGIHFSTSLSLGACARTSLICTRMHVCERGNGNLPVIMVELCARVGKLLGVRVGWVTGRMGEVVRVSDVAGCAWWSGYWGWGRMGRISKMVGGWSGCGGRQGGMGLVCRVSVMDGLQSSVE